MLTVSSDRERHGMRRHGWSGDLPRDDAEAVERILAVARACIDRDGADAGIADVARELGVTRPTVYRYFRTTDDLLRATAIDAASSFLDRLADHLGDAPLPPDRAVVEAVAFTIERLPDEPYLGLLLSPGRVSVYAGGVTSPTALELGRPMLERFPVDWAGHGIDDATLDELVEQMLRILQSLVVDPGDPARRGHDLRSYLDRWLGAAVRSLTSGRTPTRRR
jgi:AcrR family transcriptional regulator